MLRYPEDGKLIGEDERGDHRIVFRGTPNSEFEILIAYSVDSIKYSEYLGAHGIKSTPVGTVTTATKMFGNSPAKHETRRGGTG